MEAKFKLSNYIKPQICLIALNFIVPRATAVTNRQYHCTTVNRPNAKFTFTSIGIFHSSHGIRMTPNAKYHIKGGSYGIIKTTGSCTKTGSNNSSCSVSCYSVGLRKLPPLTGHKTQLLTSEQAIIKSAAALYNGLIKLTSNSAAHENKNFSILSNITINLIKSELEKCSSVSPINNNTGKLNYQLLNAEHKAVLEKHRALMREIIRQNKPKNRN